MSQIGLELAVEVIAMHAAVSEESEDDEFRAGIAHVDTGTLFALIHGAFFHRSFERGCQCQYTCDQNPSGVMIWFLKGVYMKKRIMTLAAALLLVVGFAFALPKDGTYKAKEAKPDERGYTADVAVTVKGGKITKVVYNETKGGKASKWGDANYNAMMKKVSGVSWSEAVQKLEADLQAKGDANAVDAVSGATELSARFKTLVAQALSK